MAYCFIPPEGDTVLDMVDEALASCVAIIDVVLEKIEVRNSPGKTLHGQYCNALHLWHDT